MVDEAKGGKADAEKKYMDAAGQVRSINTPVHWNKGHIVIKLSYMYITTPQRTLVFVVCGYYLYCCIYCCTCIVHYWEYHISGYFCYSFIFMKSLDREI